MNLHDITPETVRPLLSDIEKSAIVEVHKAYPGVYTFRKRLGHPLELNGGGMDWRVWVSPVVWAKNPDNVNKFTWDMIEL